MAIYFADTSFWLALARKKDQHHWRAAAWSRFLIQTESRIVTTEAVLWEWMNALCHASTRRIAAEDYLSLHADSSIEVVPFESDLIESAVWLYKGRADKDWSLTDCLSFIVMERRHLTQALTTDRHFDQAGLKAVMRQEPPIEN